MAQHGAALIRRQFLRSSSAVLIPGLAGEPVFGFAASQAASRRLHQIVLGWIGEQGGRDFSELAEVSPGRFIACEGIANGPCVAVERRGEPFRAAERRALREACLALADAAAVVGRLAGVESDRASLVASLESRSREPALANDVLRRVSSTESIENICQAVASLLRGHFEADHVAMGSVLIGQRTRTTLAWDSSVLAPEELPVELTAADLKAFAPARAGKAEVIADLQAVPRLNPWTLTARDAGLRSLIRAPLRIGEDSLGLVAIGSRAPRKYTAADAEVLLEVCRPLGLALDRAAAIANVRSLSSKALAHNRLLRELSTGLSEREMAALFASTVREHFDADGVAVAQMDESGAELILLAIEPPGNGGAGKPGAIPIDDERVRARILSGLPLTTGDVLLDAEGLRLRPFAIPRGLRTFIDVPFAGPLGMRGLVTMASRTPFRWGDDEAAELAEFTSTLAERLQLRTAGQDAAEHLRRIEATNRVLSLFTGGHDGALAGRFLEVTMDLIGAEHGTVWEFDEGGEGRVVAFQSAFMTAGELPPASVEDVDLAWRDERMVVLASADVEAERTGSAFWLEQGSKSLLAARLTAEGRTTGLVTLRSRRSGAFGGEQAELLGALVGPFGLAMERERALASLAESESKYRSLVNHAEELICVFDGSTLAVLEMNTHALRVLGYDQSELADLRLEGIWADGLDEVASSVEQVLTSGELRIPERFYRRKDGSTVEVEILASLIQYGGKEAVLTLARELSERRSLQRQLLQSQKMESLGTLAGQIAHDFNNLLTTILGFSGLLKRSPNISNEEKENLELIEQAAKRGADLTGRLLTFARGGFARFGPVDVGAVLADTLRLVRATFHREIVIETEIDPQPPLLVEGDSSQLQQAFLNILINARDALQGEGTIRVKLARRRQKAIVTISDTGPGMDEDTRLRIFEPFFTTKASGSGTGLGLAITYGIIQGHKGDLRVSSAPGEGATFTIALPLAKTDAPPGA